MTTLNTIIKEEKKEFWSKFAGKNTSLIPMNINTWLTTAMQRAYEAGKADSAHENTPDIEWEKELEQHAPNLTFKSLDNGVNTISMVWLKSFIRTTLTSRDTYWEERVREMIEEKITHNAQFLRKPSQDGETNFQTKRRRANNNYIKGQEQACEDLLQALDNLK